MKNNKAKVIGLRAEVPTNMTRLMDFVLCLVEQKPSGQITMTGVTRVTTKMVKMAQDS